MAEREMSLMCKIGHSLSGLQLVCLPSLGAMLPGQWMCADTDMSQANKNRAEGQSGTKTEIYSFVCVHGKELSWIAGEVRSPRYVIDLEAEEKLSDKALLMIVLTDVSYMYNDYVRTLEIFPCVFVQGVLHVGALLNMHVSCYKHR